MFTRILTGETFAARLDQSNGVGQGFDFLRIFLALSIFYVHAAWLSDSGPAVHGVSPLATWSGPWRAPLIALVPVFFALSGFLVAGSAMRLGDVRPFLAFRFLRIFPALIVEVTLSALVLGPLFTRLDLLAYVSDPQFFRYFGNMLGWVTFNLPGVFLNNPVPATVNANLWTLPSELHCYILLLLLMMSRVLYSRKWLSIMFGLASAILIAFNLFTDFGVTAQHADGATIVFYFFCGLMAYEWKDKIPFRPSLFCLSVASACVLLTFGHSIYLAAPFVTYATVFIGLVRIPKSKWLSSGDYSYGIYLYGYPLTQAVVAFLPRDAARPWVLLAATLVTLVFCVLSWHLIEKHALKLKAHLPASFRKKKARATDDLEKAAPVIAAAPIDHSMAAPARCDELV